MINIIKIAKMLLAAKWSNQLLNDFQGKFLKEEMEGKSYQQLSDEEKQQLEEAKNKARQVIQTRIKEYGEKIIITNERNKTDTGLLYKWIATTLQKNKINILNEDQYVTNLQYLQTYNKYKHLLEKQDIIPFSEINDFKQFFDQVQPIIVKRQEQLSFLKDYNIIVDQGKYIVVKLQDYNKCVNLFNKDYITWCVKRQSMWDTYGAPYYLIYENLKPSYLLNFNSYQFRDTGNKAPKSIDKQLALIVLGLMTNPNENTKTGGKLIFEKSYGSECFAPIYPYYPIEKLAEQKEYSKISDILAIAYKNNDNTKIEECTKVLQNSAQTIDYSKILNSINTKGQLDRLLKKFPTLQIKFHNVRALLFNGIKNKKQGQSLVAQMMAYEPIENNSDIYVKRNVTNYNANMTDEYNRKIQYYVSTISQIKLLEKLNIQISDSDWRTIGDNAVREKIEDTIQYLVENGKFAINESTLKKVIEARASKITANLLENEQYVPIFNKPIMYGATPLSFCINNTSDEDLPKDNYFNLLINSGKIEYDNQSTFDMLIKGNKFKTFKLFADKGAFRNINNILINMLEQKNYRMATQLLKSELAKKIDVNEGLPLHYAIVNKLTQIIDLLLKTQNINLGLKDNTKYDGNTPIMLSIIQENNQLLDKLLKSKNKSTALGQVNNDGLTALALMIEHNFTVQQIKKVYTSAIRTLGQEKGQEVALSALQVCDLKNKTPNMQAIEEFLISQNSLKVKNKKANLSEELFNFVTYNNIEKVRNLIKSPDVSFDYKVGNCNILHAIVQNHNSAMLELILTKIPNDVLKTLKQERFRGATPIEMAQQHKEKLPRYSDEYDKIIILLGGDVDSTRIGKILKVANLI